jgi:hypothetical protein
MKRTCAFLRIVAVVVCVAALAPAVASAQATSIPGLKGAWVGKVDILLPEGVTHQDHRFEFVEQQGAYLKGQRSWAIPTKNLKSHVGETATYQATEPLLAVVGYDGIVEVVEQGDTTRFRMRLINPDTLEFTAWEGGAHPLVGRGVLVRE